MRGWRTSSLGLVAAAVGCAFLYGFHFTWGLPHGEDTWSVDALAPLTPLAAVYRSFAGGWNNGWFYYKYPLGHCFLLVAAYAPYLLYLRLRGAFTHPSVQYPWGFSDPTAALFSLAVIGRAVTFAMALGSVAVAAYGASLLWGRRSAPWAAVAVGVTPTMVYYAHTTNLDVPQLFWMLVAWAAAVRSLCGCCRDVDAARRNAVLFGVASALALATKESAYAWLLGCTAVLVAGELTAWRAGRRTAAGIAAVLAIGAAAGGLMLLVVSNGLYNPSGFLHRLQYLTGTLPPELHARYAPRAPYVSGQILPPPERWPEIAAVVLWTVGAPWLLLALWGLVAGLRRRPEATLAVLVPALTWMLAVGPLPDVTVRYLWPAAVALALLAAPAAAEGVARGRRGQVLVGLATAFTVARAVGVDYLLLNDPRYQAEQWLRRNAAFGTRVETYHKGTYLPRPVPGVEFSRPAFEETTVPGFLQRRPDLVLLCLRDTDRVIGRYDRFEPVMHLRQENVEFLRALQTGALGYRPVARFHARWPLLPDGYIRGLNPPLVIYAREQ